MNKKPKICILVSNDLIRDPRVTKQAATASKSGFETLVACWAYSDIHPPLVEKKDGYLIHRGVFNPFWSPKILLVNFRLARFNLALGKNFLLRGLKPVVKKLVYWLVLRNLAKILHLFLPEGFSKKRTENPISIMASSIANQPSQPKSPNAVLPTPKQSIIIKMILFMNVYRYYYHYYKTMYQFMVDEGVVFRPDIIHANDLDTLLAGYLIKRKTGARLIYDAHEIWTEQGLAYPKIINLSFKLLEKFLFGKIDHFVTVNQSIANALDKTYRFPKNLKQSIIYNCPKYQQIEFQKHSPRKVIALYQGRYSANRGLEQIAHSAKYLNPEVEIHFRGLGDEKILEELKNISEKNNCNNIKFHSPVEMKDLVESASFADIGIIAYLPIHVDNELCMPNKVFEYMMAGLALTVSDLPELRYVVKTYQNGATFNPYNPKDIAKKINRLAQNHLSELRKKSLSAAKICCWETEEKKLIAIYKKLS